jgi:hypothetical protein
MSSFFVSASDGAPKLSAAIDVLEAQKIEEIEETGNEAM